MPSSTSQSSTSPSMSIPSFAPVLTACCIESRLYRNCTRSIGRIACPSGALPELGLRPRIPKVPARLTLAHVARLGSRGPDPGSLGVEHVRLRELGLHHRRHHRGVRRVFCKCY